MRRFLLSLMTLVILPLSLTVIILWTTILSIDSPKTLKAVITKNDTYSKIITILPNYLTQDDNSPVIFDKSQKSRIVQAAISQKFLQNNIEKITNDFISWINGKKVTFSRIIDLSKIKDNARDEITTIYKEKYAALPECTPAELLLNKMQDEHQFPTCRIPSESKYESVYKSFDPTIVTTDSINSFPDKIELPLPKTWTGLPSIFAQFRVLLIIATLIDILLLSLSLYILWPFPKKLLRYLGTIFIILGAFIFAYKYFVLELLGNTLNDSASASLKNHDLSSILLPLIQNLITDLKNNFYLLTLGLLGLGILFLLINLFVKVKPPTDHEVISLGDEEDEDDSQAPPKPSSTKPIT